MSDTTEPKSSAPDFNQMELEINKLWKEQGTFEKSLEQTKNGKPYIFFDGPPFATGLPHYGHILASTIKDFIPRYQTMKGRFVRRRWGWDCHGLPIENIVEQKLQISGKKQIEELGVDVFNKTCRENVLSYTEEWGKMVDRMARWVEFENSYKTMDTTFMESVWWAVDQIWKKDLIYEGYKVLLYCSRCETPLSNFEVAMDNSYKDVTENSVFVKFKLVAGQQIGSFAVTDRTYALAWTTTPWTLPGNTALNIGPDIVYVIVKQGDDYLILAKDRLSVLQGEYQIILETNAESLEGKEYQPLFAGVIDNPNQTAFKIYREDYVTTTDGSGIVHNAAMYGEEDYEAAGRRNLPKQPMLSGKGTYLDSAPEYLRGLFFKDGDRIVLDHLEQAGLVYQILPYTHSYPFCWRCATPLFYNALSAWFINIQKVKPRLLELNETVNWYPDHLKHGRFGKGIETAPDWNISRNRFWATPLPFWKCNDCKAVKSIGSIDQLRKEAQNFDAVYPNYASQKDAKGINDISVVDLHKPYIDQITIACSSCSGTMHRIPEVIDCWVESASMPFAEFHYPFENNETFNQRYPAQFVAEYIAQTRAWFYVMHVLGVILFDKAPFEHVVTTGNILAEDGSKMSKSKKNYPDPWELINRYGIDPVRFYLMSSPIMHGDDLNFSEKAVAEVQRKVTLLLWNMHSFLRMYTKESIAVNQVPQSNHVLDRWVLARLAKTNLAVTQFLDQYDTVRASRELVDVINEVSTWYVRRSRDRIKAGDGDSQAALNTLGYALSTISTMLAPWMPYVSEYIYRDVTGKESVHLASWPTLTISADQDQLLDHMQAVRDAVELGLALRKDAGIKIRQPLGAIHYQLKSKGVISEELTQVLAEELNVKNVSASDTIAPTDTLLVKENSTATIGLDISITPELAAEGTARELERQIQDLRKTSRLQIGEMVDVYYTTQSAELSKVMDTLVDRRKVFAQNITTSLEVEADFEVQAEIDGKAIWLGIVRI